MRIFFFTCFLLHFIASFQVKLGESQAGYSYTFKWQETQTCPHHLDTTFSTSDFISGVKLSQKLYPWADEHIQKFEESNSLTDLYEIGKIAIKRRQFDQFVLAFIIVSLLVSSFFWVAECCRKSRPSVEKMGMLTKLMKNTKCSQVNKVLMVIFGIWSVLNVFQIRHHASNVLESWKMVDCSYHRVL